MRDIINYGDMAEYALPFPPQFHKLEKAWLVRVRSSGSDSWGLSNSVVHGQAYSHKGFSCEKILTNKVTCRE